MKTTETRFVLKLLPTAIRLSVRVAGIAAFPLLASCGSDQMTGSNSVALAAHSRLQNAAPGAAGHSADSTAAAAQPGATPAIATPMEPGMGSGDVQGAAGTVSVHSADGQTTVDGNVDPSKPPHGGACAPNRHLDVGVGVQTGSGNSQTNVGVGVQNNAGQGNVDVGVQQGDRPAGSPDATNVQVAIGGSNGCGGGLPYIQVGVNTTGH